MGWNGGGWSGVPVPTTAQKIVELTGLDASAAFFGQFDDAIGTILLEAANGAQADQTLDRESVNLDSTINDAMFVMAAPAANKSVRAQNTTDMDTGASSFAASALIRLKANQAGRVVGKRELGVTGWELFRDAQGDLNFAVGPTPTFGEIRSTALRGLPLDTWLWVHLLCNQATGFIYLCDDRSTPALVQASRVALPGFPLDLDNDSTFSIGDGAAAGPVAGFDCMAFLFFLDPALDQWDGSNLVGMSGKLRSDTVCNTVFPAVATTAGSLEQVTDQIDYRFANVYLEPSGLASFALSTVDSYPGIVALQTTDEGYPFAVVGNAATVLATLDNDNVLNLPLNYLEGLIDVIFAIGGTLDANSTLTTTLQLGIGLTTAGAGTVLVFFVSIDQTQGTQNQVQVLISHGEIVVAGIALSTRIAFRVGAGTPTLTIAGNTTFGRWYRLSS